MPIAAAAAMTVTGTDTDARDYTTASWTPVAGNAYLVALSVLDLGSQRDTDNQTCTGNNMNWLKVTSVGGGANEPALTVWAAIATPSSTAGAITFAGTVTSGQTADGAIWGIAELTGTNSDFVVQSNLASTPADSINTTLAAFQSPANATCAWVVSYNNASTTDAAITAGSGFAKVTNLDVGQAMGGDGTRLVFEFREDNDTGVDATSAAANDRMLIIAMELSANVGSKRPIIIDQAVHRASRW